MADDVANLVKRAAEAAKLAPEHLQEAAFNKAFDALIAGSAGSQSKSAKPQKGNNRKAKRMGKVRNSPESQSSIEHLDRTAHPEINHNNSLLNNALWVLRAAKDDLDIDGMTASDIGKILIDKFRCKGSQQGVSKALNKANLYVNRHKEGNSVLFRLMAPGHEYLDILSTEKEPSMVDSAKKSTVRKKAKAKTQVQGKKQKKAPSNSKKTSGKRKTGPATAMSHLYDADFFSSGKTIADIIAKLRNDSGRLFKQNELSPVLLRWLRSGKLARKQNTDNQYEYKKP